jgi:hypothetical protein
VVPTNWVFRRNVAACEDNVLEQLQAAVALGESGLEPVGGLVKEHGVVAVASGLLTIGTADALMIAHKMGRAGRAQVRSAGVRALIDFRTSAAQEHLFDILVTTPDPETRELALARLREEPPEGISWMCMESPARPDYDAGAEMALVELLAEAVGEIPVRDRVVSAIREHGDLVGAQALARTRQTTARKLGLELRTASEPLQRECAAHLLSVGNTPDVDVVFPLRELCRDNVTAVGVAAARVLLEVSDKALKWARKLVASASGAKAALRVLGVAGHAQDLPAVAAWVPSDSFRSAAVASLALFDRSAVLALARAHAEGSQEDRLRAAVLLGAFAVDSDVPALEHLTHDVDLAVREQAFRGLCDQDTRAATARAHDFADGNASHRALGLLALRRDEVACELLCDHVWNVGAPRDQILEGLSAFDTPRAQAICTLDALSVGAPADACHDGQREALAGPLAEAGLAAFLPGLGRGRDSDVAPRLIRGVLTIDSPVYVPAVLDFYRGLTGGAWPAEILEGVATKRHPDAVREVIVALGERDATVRNKAEWILANHALADRPVEFWRGFLATWQRLCTWTEAVSWEFLGGGTWLKPVREGVGLTWFRHAHDGSADVEVTLQPLLDGREEAWDVIRGVILHEFGHHTYDFRRPGFKSANGNADAAGVKPIFDLLLDERLERNLRAQDPFYGTLIDRANAYFREGPPVRVTAAEVIECVGEENARAWAASTGVDLEAGPLLLSAWDAAQIPDLLPRLDAFFVGLLVVRNPSRFADPLVRQALELVPSNLKDCSHAELFRISLAVGDLLGVRDNGAAARRRRKAARGRLGRLVQGAVGKAGAATGVGAARTSHSPAAKASVQAAKALRAKLAKARPARLPRRGGLTAKAVGGQDLNTSADIDFPELRLEVALDVDLEGFRKLVRENRRHVTGLRRHFELLGSKEVELRAQPRGHRLDVGQVRRLVTQPTTRLLVRHDDDVGANAYIGLLIDRSGSMAGEKIAIARRFAALLAEAAGGVRGLTGHVNAFDDDTFYRLGDFRRNAIASLGAGGGNNDAGGLLRAAQLALQSGKDNRLLVMISDGSPTECSVAALGNLVQYLTQRRGIACSQVCVAHVRDRVFPVTLDVKELGIDAAVHEFGRLLVRLTRSWR